MNELTPVPLPAVQDNSPVAIMLSAVAQGMPLDKVEKMMDLQERWERTEARKAFVAAMTQFKREPLEIFKTKQVAFLDVRYKHAELSSVTDVVVPALARHGFSHRWDIQQTDGQITVSCTVTHERGHFETVSIQGAADTSAKKNAIQSIASTVTYLKRYTLLAITGLSTKEEADDDGAGGRDEVDPAEAEAAATAARAVAAQGFGAFREYFASLSEGQRLLIEPLADELKGIYAKHTLAKAKAVQFKDAIVQAPDADAAKEAADLAIGVAKELGDTFSQRVFSEALAARLEALNGNGG